MGKLLTISVRNEAYEDQRLYLFQQPAVYSGGEEVYSNCLGSGTLPSYHMTGSTHIFQVERRCYAGVEMTVGPAIGNASGFGLAFRPIEPAPPEGSSGVANNWTRATLEPHTGLSAPAAGEGVPPGGFRISTPSFDTRRSFNVGAVVSASDGNFLLSNFVKARPLSNIDIQPSLKFYVQTGTSFPGRVVDFSQSSTDAALVDFTDGHESCEVSLASSGWRIDYQ